MWFNDILMMLLVSSFTALLLLAIKVRRDVVAKKGASIPDKLILGDEASPQDIMESDIEDMGSDKEKGIELEKFKEIGLLLEAEVTELDESYEIFEPARVGESHGIITGTDIFESGEASDTVEPAQIIIDAPDIMSDEGFPGAVTCPHCNQIVPSSLYCLNCGESLLEQRRPPQIPVNVD